MENVSSVPEFVSARPISNNLPSPAPESRLDRTTELLRARVPSGSTQIQIFVALGLLLRLRQYFLFRSLWLDESFLSLNIIHRSAHELLKPLDYHQGAPILFLLLQKAIVTVFGSGELALRFIPLVCGIASIFLFVKFARWILPPNAVPIAVALFAIAEPLTYFSSEVKQYSGAVFAGLVMCLLESPLVEGRPPTPGA